MNTDVAVNNSLSKSGISHLRYRAYCFSELMAEKIYSAMKLLGLEDPELEKTTVFSWDSNQNIDRFTIKCWFSRTKNYEDIDAQIKELVFEGVINDV